MSVSKRIPKYRHYKPKNLAVVRIEGKDHYLGRYDSPESWEKYHRLVVEWLSEKRKPVGTNDSTSARQEDPIRELTVNELILSYWRYAEKYYVRDGEVTKELACMQAALRPLRRLFGTTLASEFGPVKLKTLQNHMIDEQDLCRNEVNKRTGRIKRAFRWAVSEEMIPSSIVHGLDSVKGLRKGRTHARESKPIKPAPDDAIEAILPFLPPTIVTMIEVQRLTGMRPSELVRMRPCDIDVENDIWIYNLEKHKTDWRGQTKMVPLGPKCQQLLKPYMERPAESFLFSPVEAQQWRIDHRISDQTKRRKTPIYPSELRAREKAKAKRRRKRSKRGIGACYTSASYWKAIEYAFRKAKKTGVEIQKWSPSQLRHSRGTEVRKAFGIEASRVSLGHARLETTEIYAEKDLKLAIEVAREIG